MTFIPRHDAPQHEDGTTRTVRFLGVVDRRGGRPLVYVFSIGRMRSRSLHLVAGGFGMPSGPGPVPLVEGQEYTVQWLSIDSDTFGWQFVVKDK